MSDMPDLRASTKSKDLDIRVAFFEIEHDDVFHLKNLYKHIYRWLQEENYTDMSGEGGTDLKPEKLYFERVSPDGNKEHWIWWRCIKIPQGNSYFRYYLRINYQTLYSGSQEIVHKGVKMKTNKSDLIIRIQAWLQLDYQNKWDNHPILKHFHKWFRERLYKPQWERHKLDFYVNVYKLQREIKQYLEFKTFAEEPKMFHHRRGV